MNNMIWKGENLNTIGKVCDAMQKIETPEEAKEFMDLGRKAGSAWDENIGYLTGYFSSEEADRMRKLFLVSHPIFGNAHPTAEERSRRASSWGSPRRTLWR